MTSRIVLEDSASGVVYPVTIPCVIGRGTDADLSLPDAAVSHHHARIEEAGGNIAVRDLGSRNGVFVNGVKIQDRAVLKDGDSLQLGRTALTIRVQGADVAEETVILHSLDSRASVSLDHKRLQMIYDITAGVSDAQDVGALGVKVFSELKGTFNQDRGYLAVFQEDGTLKPICVDPPGGSLPLSRSIVNRIFQTGDSLALEDALGDTALGMQESVIGLRIRSALCVPLIYHEQMYGLMYLDRNVPGSYSRQDLEFLRSIASILAPLVENARLLSELRKHYSHAVETLRLTESRLIEVERTAAYVRLAQAMAHEIRNPLMIVGGTLRRMVKTEQDASRGASLQELLSSVERVEAVLREVDTFVKLHAPERRLQRIDDLLKEAIARHHQDWQRCSLQPFLRVQSSHVMIPVDPGLMQKALSMIFREILFAPPPGPDLPITLRDSGNDLSVCIGDMEAEAPCCELYDEALQKRPWALSLFLNIAYKIITEHGGTLLLDPSSNSAFPVMFRLPRLVPTE